MPKRSDLYKTVREHFAQGENQEIINLAERTTPLPAGVAYYVGAALISLGDYAAARQHIEAALETAEGADKANLIALDSLIEEHRGHDDVYLRRAKEAVAKRVTVTTLYHLGTATGSEDIQAAIPLLQASLTAAEEENDPYAEARNALALAISHMRAGAHKDALSWARFAYVRTTHPGLKIYGFNFVAFLQILVDDTAPLENELKDIVELAEASAPAYERQRTVLMSTLADLYHATERYDEALTIYEAELRDAPRVHWSWLSHGYVRALCALERFHDAYNAAETAVAVTASLSAEHQMRSRLALGIALWPSEHAITPRSVTRIGTSPQAMRL